MSKDVYFLAERFLFEKKEILDSSLTEHERMQLLRIRDAYVMWRDHPDRSERQMVAFLRNTYKISSNQAYHTLHIVRNLIGQYNQCSRAWARYQFVVRNMQTREFAKARGDARAMAKCDADFAKYMRINEDDKPEIDITEIRVQPFRPVSDPTVIGLKPIENVEKYIAQLEKKYATEIDTLGIDFIEADFSESDFDFSEEKDEQ